MTEARNIPAGPCLGMYALCMFWGEFQMTAFILLQIFYSQIMALTVCNEGNKVLQMSQLIMNYSSLGGFFRHKAYKGIEK